MLTLLLLFVGALGADSVEGDLPRALVIAATMIAMGLVNAFPEED